MRIRPQASCAASGCIASSSFCAIGERNLTSEQGARICAADNKPGAFFNGGGQHDYKGEEPYGAVRAIEAVTGQLRWEYKLRFPQTPRRRTLPVCDLRTLVSSWTSPV
jgi:hypothetical protein